MPDVSVVIPVYNVERYLDECVASVLGQRFDGTIDCVLVDDGSTDSSGTICDDWAQAAEQITVVHKENGGLVSAWKAGLEQARADWIVFVDADDRVEPLHIQTLYDEQVSCGADVVVTTAKQLYPDGTAKLLPWHATTKTYGKDDLKSYLYPILLNAGGFELRGVPMSRWSKLIRKSLLVSNLDYCRDEVTYEEDMSIMFPVMLDAECISLVVADECAYCYRMVEGSMLHGYDANMMQSVRLVHQSLAKACQDKGVEGFERQLSTEFVSAFVRLATNELRNPEGMRAIQRNLTKLGDDSGYKANYASSDVGAFPLRFRLIARMVMHYGWLERNVLTPFLVATRRFVK